MKQQSQAASNWGHSERAKTFESELESKIMQERFRNTPDHC